MIRKFCILLILVSACGAGGAESNAEKLRALSEAKLKLLENVLQAAMRSFDYGQLSFKTVAAAKNHRHRTKMELAVTREERAAAARNIVSEFKALLELVIHMKESGRTSHLDALMADLELRDAELALLQELKQDSTEKRRENAEARLKITEELVANIRTRYERGVIEDSELIIWTERLNKTMMEAAKTPEERVAVSE